jgi:hypothetical protein
MPIPPCADIARAADDHACSSAKTREKALLKNVNSTDAACRRECKGGGLLAPARQIGLIAIVDFRSAAKHLRQSLSENRNL